MVTADSVAAKGVLQRCVVCKDISSSASVVSLLLYSSLIRCMHLFIYLVIVSICVPCICNLYLDLFIDLSERLKPEDCSN